MAKEKKKGKNHDKIQKFLWNRKGNRFEFHKFKIEIHKYGWYGGAKYKKWLKGKYGLQEFKEKGRIFLQKIPKEERSE